MSAVNKLGICLSCFSVQKLCKNRPALPGKEIVEQHNSQLMLSDTTGLRVNRQHIITRLLMKGIGLCEALIRPYRVPINVQGEGPLACAYFLRSNDIKTIALSK